MKEQEEKFDKLLRELMVEGTLEEPESPHYTPKLMTSVMVYERRKERIRQIIFGTVGVIFAIGIFTALILLWQSGLIREWALVGRDLLSNITEVIPFKFTPLVIVAFILHYFFNGGFIVLFFLKDKRHIKFN